MVTIITGERNSGKTTFFEYWYNKVRRGAGFYTKKLYEANEFQGYDLVFMPDGATIPFSTVVRPQHVYAGGPVLTEKLAVDREVYAFAEKKLAAVWEAPDEPVWIDEIGPRELAGEGFDRFFRRVLEECSDVRLVVRKSLLYRLVGRYGIEKFSLVYV